MAAFVFPYSQCVYKTTISSCSPFFEFSNYTQEGYFTEINLLAVLNSPAFFFVFVCFQITFYCLCVCTGVHASHNSKRKKNGRFLLSLVLLNCVSKCANLTNEGQKGFSKAEVATDG